MILISFSEDNARHKLKLNNSLKLCDDETIKGDYLNHMPSHLKDSKYDCDTNSGTETCDHPQIVNKTFQTKGDHFEVNEHKCKTFQTKGDHFEVNEHKCKNLDKIQTKCNTHSASNLQTEETSIKTDIHEDKGDNLNLESSNVKGDNLNTVSNVKGDNCEKSKCNQNAPLHIVWAHRW